MTPGDGKFEEYTPIRFTTTDESGEGPDVTIEAARSSYGLWVTLKLPDGTDGPFVLFAYFNNQLRVKGWTEDDWADDPQIDVVLVHDMAQFMEQQRQEQTDD